MLDPRPSWQTMAECRGYPEVMYPGEDDVEGNDRAKAVCVGCSVLVQCQDYALANREQHGVWGGMTEKERRRFRRQSQAARIRDTAPVPPGRHEIAVQVSLPI